MGFSEDDRIRRKNQVFDQKSKVEKHRFKLELHGTTNVTQIVEALTEAGLSVKLDRDNKIIIK